MQSVLGTTHEHHRRLGLTQGVIAPWEDGLRTNPEEESFEWWYLDAGLSDGSKLTIEFHTKPPYASPREPLTPFISATLDRADGTNVTRTLVAPAADFSASREGCDVTIAGNTFAGDLRDYRVQICLDGFVADLLLHAAVPPWRPATGHLFCGEKYVAWLPVVPRGAVTGSLVIDGVQTTVDGVGYHDHNWGTAPLRKLIDHWYWGRARVGDYTIVTLNFISHADWGRNRHPAFMVAKGSEILASGETGVEFSATNIHTNPATGAQVANSLLYTYCHDDANYSVKFERDKDVFTLDFGKAGAYHRFVGTATLAHHESGQLLERVTDGAMWELLDFRPRNADAPTLASAPLQSLVHRA